jgi:hypothetical protein
MTAVPMRILLTGSLKYINGNPSTVWPIVLTAEVDGFPSTEG